MMILNFHNITFSISCLLWIYLLGYSYFYPYYRSENKIALINNFQVIFLASFVYLIFESPDPGIFWKPSIRGYEPINLFIAISAYLSLGYNIVDIFIQIWKAKWPYVAHHLAIIPFLIGYLYQAAFYHLFFVYALMEVSSFSFNLRQIYPGLDFYHRIFYIVVRMIASPLLIYVYIQELESDYDRILPELVFTTCLSNFLIFVFSSVSVYLAITGFGKKIKKE